MIQQIEILHNKGLVHGNLNPKNIIPFSSGDGVIILDALTVLNNSELKKANRYSSPEILQNSRSKMKEDDNWSVGMIMMEMCFSQIPLKMEEYFSISKEKIEKLFQEKNYSQELIEIIINQLINRKISREKEIKEENRVIKRKSGMEKSENDIKRKRISLNGNEKVKIDSRITSESKEVIKENHKNLSKIKEIDLKSNRKKR